MEFDEEKNNRVNRIEVIKNGKIYAKELPKNHLLGFYYLVSWKNKSKAKNTWEPILTLQYLRKLLNNFHKDYQDELTPTFPWVNVKLAIVKPSAKLLDSVVINKKRRRFSKSSKPN